MKTLKIVDFNWKLAGSVSVFPSLIVATKRMIDGATAAQIAVSAGEVFATSMLLLAAFHIIWRWRGEKESGRTGP